MAIQTLTLNVNAQPSAEDRAFLYLSQNENGRDIRFRILGDDLPSGCTATLSGVKPDGNVWSKAGTVTNNFVVVEEDIQMTAVAGRWDAQLDIVNGSKNIVTALIRITVEAAAVEAGAVPSDTQLEGYVEQCKQYAETAKNEAYGSPLTAATAAAMTDQRRVYVYTGSETGYTAGHWYYHNGTSWTDGGVYNAVAVDTDTTLSVSGKAADAKKTGDELSTIKEDFNALENDVVATKNITPSALIDNHYIAATNNTPIFGKSYYSTSYKHTDFISCVGYKRIAIDVPKTTDANIGIVFYSSANFESGLVGYLYKNAGLADDVTHGTIVYDVPNNATYMRITVQKTVEESFFVTGYTPKTDVNAVNITILGAKTDALKTAVRKHYMVDNPTKALFPEFVSEFWCSNLLPSALTGKQLVLTVSGTMGDDHITPSAISPDTISISDIDVQTGMVLTTDGTTYEVYNVIYDSGSSSLSIYPPLRHTVIDATLAQFYLDSGPSYVGLHLTAHGYKAYAYRLYSQNPKHCEVGKYNAYFDSREATEHPFTKISSSTSTPLYLGISDSNQNMTFLKTFFTKNFNAQFASSYTPYNSKNGVYWDVNLNGTSGYLELLLCAYASTMDLPTGQELYVDVYIDGELIKQEIITDTIGKRICIDYANATTGRIEVYYNKFALIDGGGFGFRINKAVWWINELEYADNQKLFPTGSVVAMEFDSWGVFHDGITGTALHDLINADAGCTVNFTNHSLGSQTSAWGKAYWYQNIKAYNPAIAITDFQINDKNSVGSSSVPDTITGPDGKSYVNKITKSIFSENTQKMIAYAVNNKIQPLVMRNTQINYFSFVDALIEDIATQYVP